MNKVINFHNVNDAKWFENAITIIIKKYNIISINELEEYYYKGKRLENSCHITFDDGDKTFADIILPILNKFNVPASLFVSPFISSTGQNFWFQEIEGYNSLEIKRIISDQANISYNLLKKYSLIEIFKTLRIDQILNIIRTYQELFDVKPKESQNMSNEQLIEIDRHGLITIGAHTQNHPILANEDSDKSRKEIIESFQELEKILGHHVIYFAYPNGIPEIDFGIREEIILKEVGCKIAFSTTAKNINSNQNPLTIPRYGLIDGDTEKYIKAKLFLGEYWVKIKKGVSKEDSKRRLENRKSLNPGI